ncbi:MAG: hypothetical protein JST30_05850 [Armatimonadetes bacterium]|nr:hypothetical protein [Armatimonadota bacterium]
MSARSWGVLFVAATVGAAHAQLPQLGTPTPVDVRVDNVLWHPHGLALLYSRKEKEGLAIGVYEVGGEEGRVVLRLPAGTRWMGQWFENQRTCVLIVSKSLGPKEDVDPRELSVHLLDARTLTDRVVFKRVFKPDERLDMNVDPSPSLFHAIFRLRSQGPVRHFVLSPGASVLTPAPDIDAAVTNGFHGPSWSIYGTAVYSQFEPRSQSKLDRSYERAKARDKAAAAVQQEAEAEQVAKYQAVKLNLTLETARWLAKPSPPPTGSDVAEVVPSNGVLRPVRFRGPWEDAVSEWPLLTDVNRPMPLRFDPKTESANSVWLVLKSDPEKAGTLVGADVDRVWVSPWNNAVAYLVDGALFVRPCEKP